MKSMMVVALLLGVSSAFAIEYVFTVQETHDVFSSTYGLDCDDIEGRLFTMGSYGAHFYEYGTWECTSLWASPSPWGGCMLVQSADYWFCHNSTINVNAVLRDYYNSYVWSSHPAEKKGHGMDCGEDGYIWEIDYNNNLYKMNLVGDELTVVIQYNLTEMSGSSQGLTTVDLYGLGLVNHLLISANSNMYLYEIIGSALVFVDEIPNPVDDYSPRGLAFSIANQTFYWCYQATSSSNSVKIVRMILEEGGALEQTTWGAIKSIEL